MNNQQNITINYTTFFAEQSPNNPNYQQPHKRSNKSDKQDSTTSALPILSPYNLMLLICSIADELFDLTAHVFMGFGKVQTACVECRFIGELFELIEGLYGDNQSLKVEEAIFEKCSFLYEFPVHVVLVSQGSNVFTRTHSPAHTILPIEHRFVFQVDDENHIIFCLIDCKCCKYVVYLPALIIFQYFLSNFIEKNVSFYVFLKRFKLSYQYKFLDFQEMQSNIMVMNTQSRRETGRKVQLTNIQVAKAVSEIVTSTLGPQSMLKMLIDPMGGIVMTNDGNAILREIDVQHPAAKTVIELARVQDEQVGDGTTSVIIMTGQLMLAARPFMQMNIHPTVVVSAYYKAMQFAKRVLCEISKPIDITKDDDIMMALQSCIGTKFSSRWGKLIANLTIKATKTILRQGTKNKLNLQIKRYARIQKIPGGTLEECEVLNGVMINKDITHPKMRRLIKNPRIILLDCPLQYKKGESQTNMELRDQNAMCDALNQEMEEIAMMCNFILKWKPDVVITEKGVSDLAQHFLLKGNVSCIRRIRKTDNVRVARVSGAKIVNRPEQIQQCDVGTQCGLFDIRKIGDDYFTYFVDCKAPTACSIILRGASKDVLNEMERNLHDCLGVSKNLYTDPRLVPGGGAAEMQISSRLNQEASKYEGIEQLPFRAVGYALEIIPKTLATNCGMDVVRIITELRAKHSEPGFQTFGIDGNNKKISDMSIQNVWEPIAVKNQIIKTSIQASCLLLRIDDIVSGVKRREKEKKGPAQSEQPNETFGDQRDG